MYYENFEKLCRERFIRPSAVAKETGVSTATLSAWKLGKYTPKLDKIQTICDFFGVPLTTITGFEVASSQDLTAPILSNKTSTEERLMRYYEKLSMQTQSTTQLSAAEEVLIHAYRRELPDGLLHQYVNAFWGLQKGVSEWQKQSTPEEKTEDSEQD